MRVEAVHVYYVNHPCAVGTIASNSLPTPVTVNARTNNVLNSASYTTRHVQHPHASMSSRLRAGQMQHIRSRLGRAVTTRARHTHTAQARLRTRPGTQSASPRVVAGPHLAPVVHTAVQSQLRSFDEPSPRSRLTTVRGHLLQSPCIVPASVLLSVAPHVSALSPNRMQYAPSTHRAGAPDPALLNVALPGPHTSSAA